MSKVKRAAIDIGSNSLNLLLAEITTSSTGKDQNLHEILSESYVTQLGKGVQTSLQLAPETMAETLRVLKLCVDKAKDFGVSSEKIVTVATEASRVAQNAPGFYAKVLKETGINVQIINGHAEAELSALGAASSTMDQDFFLLDIGGASTEFVAAHKNPFKFFQGVSTPMGSVRALEWAEKGQLEEKLDEIFREYSTQLSLFSQKNLLCVAGTMTTIFTMIKRLKRFSAIEIEGATITRTQFSSFVADHRNRSLNDLNENYPFLGKRLETIKAGMIMANLIFEKLSTHTITCSTRGLRFGVLMRDLAVTDFYRR